jgi:hypothetical protein
MITEMKASELNNEEGVMNLTSISTNQPSNDDTFSASLNFLSPRESVVPCQYAMMMRASPEIKLKCLPSGSW